MQKIKKVLAHKIFKIFLWAFLVLIGLFIILIIVRVVHFVNVDKTNAQIAKINAMKLSEEDVFCKNFSKDFGISDDGTLEGVDINENGIRDDVELAICNTYKNSAKTRAVLLQYAMTLQMMPTQYPLSKNIATAIMQEKSRAYACVGEILFRNDEDRDVMEKYFEKGKELRSFVEDKQLNAENRIKNNKDFYKLVRSYSESQKELCDINVSNLPN